MDIKLICEDFGIENFKINKDGTVDVFGNVFINRYGLKELPLIFRDVYGNFNCYSNKLTTLKGSPIRVGGDFVCSWNQLKTLEYSPTIVCGDFYCQHNKIICIEDGPAELFGEFYSNEIPIDGLKYCDDYQITRISNYKNIILLKNRREKIKKLLSNILYNP